MKCPRCRRESRDGLIFCAACGAPLALRTEPPSRPLDVALSLDRRGGERAAPPALPLAGPVGGAPRLAVGDAPGSAGWALEPPSGAGLSIEAPADGLLEDFEFHPLPELSTQERLEPGPFAPGPVEREPREPAPPPGLLPTVPPARPGPGPLDRVLELGRSPALERVLGFAPDPVLERDLDLGGEPTERDGLAAPLESARAAAPTDDTGASLDFDLSVTHVEVRLRRPATWRRAASWAVDAAPFAALAASALTALYGRLPAAASGEAGLLHLVDDGGAIALPLLAGVVVLALVYQTLAHALAGATLGKWLLGLRVVGPDGRRPSFGRAAARAVLSAASAALLGLGLAAALFTRSGRALHDISCGTWVVEAP